MKEKWVSIDIGTSTGICIWFGFAPMKTELWDLGVKTPFEERLKTLIGLFRNVVSNEKPKLVVLEIPAGHSPNWKSIAMLNQFIGCIMCLCSQAGIPFFTVTQPEVKKVVTGKGNAKKPIVREFIELFYPTLHMHKSLDVSDAVAIGRCYLAKYCNENN